MIIEALLNLLFVPLNSLLSLLPTIELSIPTSTFTSFFNALRVVCYLLPMGTILNIVSLIIVIIVFKIFVSVIKTLWQLIPLL